MHGKIVLVRYGKNFRGVKAHLAEEHGANGVIIYSDPEDDGFVKGPVYPNGPFRPADGIQRGSIQYLWEYPGDPLTPGTPSIPGTPRLQPDQATEPVAHPDDADLLPRGQPLLQRARRRRRRPTTSRAGWASSTTSGPGRPRCT